MKQRGFTLVEMLSVIVILAVLALIIVPLVNGSYTTSVNDLYAEQMETLINGAKNWSADHLSSLPEAEGGSKEVTLSELMSGGYVKKDLKNPRTKKSFESGTKVVIVNWAGDYDYVPVDGANLVSNPNQGITSWSKTIGSGGVMALSAVEKEGVNAVKVSVTSASTTWGVVLKAIQTSRLKAGEKYILEYDIHSSRAFTLNTNILNSNGTESLVTSAIKASIPANKDTHVKGEFTINTTTIGTQPLYFSPITQVGEYILWNVELYKK